MSNEAWKDTGNCKECRRKNYCKQDCRAHRERMRSIISLAATTVLARSATERMAEEASKAEQALAGAIVRSGDSLDTDRVKAALDRCKQLAAGSKYSVGQIVGGVVGTSHATGDSVETVLDKMEAQLLQAATAAE